MYVRALVRVISFSILRISGTSIRDGFFLSAVSGCSGCKVPLSNDLGRTVLEFPRMMLHCAVKFMQKNIDTLFS